MSAGSQIYPDTRRRAPRHAHLQGRQRHGPALAVLLVAAAVLGVLALGGVGESLLGGTPSSPTIPAVALGEPTPAGAEVKAGVEATAAAGPATPGTGPGASPVGLDACPAPTAAATSSPGTEARPGALASLAPATAARSGG